MPSELSLVDLVSPYVLQGDTFGAWHAVLDILRVAEHEIASDENGITIRGTVQFEGNLTVDPSSMSLTFNNAENHPENDASRRDPWIDVRDAKLDFQLVAPRTASQKVSTAVSAIGAGAAFAWKRVWHRAAAWSEDDPCGEPYRRDHLPARSHGR